MDELEAYMLDHIDREPELLKQIHRVSNVRLLHGFMVCGHLQGRLLKMLVQMIRPKRVIEIGTYTGYSALSMAEGMEEDAQLHTIEINDELEAMIRRHLSRSPHGKKIRLYIGDAATIVPCFEDASFDMAFMDGDKRNYWADYEVLLPKIRPGGFILADDTLWHGKLWEEVAGNDRMTKGIIEFNEQLKSDSRVEKVMVPVRDGLTLIRKK